MNQTRFYKILILILFVTNSVSGFSSELKDSVSIADLLIKEGYENLRVRKSADTIYVGYENRKYRQEFYAVAEILEVIIPFCEQAKELCLIAHITDVPVFQFVCSVRKYNDLMLGKISIEEFRNSVFVSFETSKIAKQLKQTEGRNQTFNKIDLVVHPLFQARFGSYSNPIQTKIGILPTVNISFWKGMNLRTQLIVPMQNDLSPDDNKIDPGLITISQFVKLPKSSFATFTAGYFTHNRYGVNAEFMKFFFDRKLALRADFGYTGYAILQDKVLTKRELKLFNWFTDIAYRNAKYDLTLRLGYGKFLFLDKGWRFDMSRQFGEVNIGFYGMKSNDIMNGGFSFIIPILPKKYSTKRFIRIRPASSFAWEYRAKALVNEGYRYKSGNSLNDFLMFYNPDYIKKEVVSLIEKAKNRL